MAGLRACYVELQGWQGSCVVVVGTLFFARSERIYLGLMVGERKAISRGVFVIMVHADVSSQDGGTVREVAQGGVSSTYN